MISVTTATFTDQGLDNNVPCLPLRQVLLMPQRTLDAFALAAGTLRENIVIDDRQLPDLHALPSGTIFQVGAAHIQLTFHCEPCQKLKPVIRPKALLHQRGVLGCFLNQGQLHVGDRVAVLPQQGEPIPYEPHERIVWYLERTAGVIAATELLRGIGLSPAYARALPALLRKIPPAYGARVQFATHTRMLPPVTEPEQ